MTSQTEVLRCGWLMNPGEPPQQDMRLEIVDGIVRDISSLRPDERFLAEAVVVMPSLVNVHTHLEFSGCATPLSPPEPFPEWIRSVIGYRTDQFAQVAVDVAAGVAESVAGGVGLLGDISTSDDSLAAFENACRDVAVRGVSFREVFGWSPERVAEQIEIAERHVVSLGGTVARALSPHAPYSVHPDLLAATVELAVQYNVPLAMHLAETREELELLDRLCGPFADFLKSRGLWNDVAIAPGTQPLRYLESLAEVTHALAIHGNYFGDQEIEFLSRHSNIAVVYCPRTHAYFRHSPHPWEQLVTDGATVILGTDGRSSNPDLSIWKELQAAAQLTNRPIWELLPMITTTAAAAIGFPTADFVIRPDAVFNGTLVKCAAGTEMELSQRLKVSHELVRWPR